MNRGPKRRGYSLIEAMVSAALVTVGIVALISAYSTLTRNQRITVEYEQMQRLAIDKYDELVATEALQTQSLNGDFSDRGKDNYLWQAAVQSTGTNNVSALTVTVQPREGAPNESASASGVVYIPPQTTTTTTAGGTP